ncbi:MAG: response regulator [Alphaproteobacteria bacterium]|nr:response regulator [Alphaproteobacteria bacterium]MDE2336731.1 response regulator [Alphaproteobacteria bacterium]
MTASYFGPRQILVVDDNADDYEALARAFKKTGLYGHVTLCTSGQMALDRLKGGAELPTLMLLDLNMPGLDGFQVLQAVKSDERLKAIPIVIWTTSSNEKDINACYRLGANAYMQKPVIFDQLVESVKRLKEYWFEAAVLPVSEC